MLQTKVRDLTMHVPIIFPKELIHAQVAKAIIKGCAGMKDAVAVSAGSIDIHGKVERGSGSDTLNLKANLPKDQEIINGIEYGSVFMFK